MMTLKRLNRKKRNGGFTIMEMIVAIGILGSLTAMTASMMGTTSGTYQQVSTESQLQSEAQLVANAISETLIDGYKVGKYLDFQSTVSTVDHAFNTSYTGFEGKFLPVWLEKDTKARIIAYKDKKLYVFDATKNLSGGFSTTAPALLGQHIEDFTADVTRAEGQRIIDFKLSYKKGSKVYNGAYQIFMRNGATLPSVSANEAPDEANIVSAVVSPKAIYVDIHDKKLSGTYYKESVMNTASTFVDKDLPELTFGATVNQNGFGIVGDALHDYYTTWTFGGVGAPASAAFAGGSDTTTNARVTLANHGTAGGIDYSQITATQFQINFEARGDTKDSVGHITNTVSKTDYATIFFRLCRRVTIYPVRTASFSAWKDEFTNADLYLQPAEQDSVGNVSDYVRPGSVITVNGDCDSPNVPDDKPKWKLEYRKINQSSDTYKEVTDASLATLGNRTGAVTMNTIRLGSLADNSYVFRVTATSSFDDSKQDVWEFGVQPPMDPGDDSGFFSRGYYQDMNSMMTKLWPGDGHQIEGIQSGIVKPKRILYLRCLGITAANININDQSTLDQMAKVVYEKSEDPADPYLVPKLYIDYQIFNGPKTQKEDFYTSNVSFHFAMGYLGTDDKFYLMWGNDGDVSAMRSKQPGIKGAAINQGSIGKFTYRPGAVIVSKIVGKAGGTDVVSNASNFVMLNKGESKTVGVTTKYYNIMRPVNGNYYFGAYLGDMSKKSDKSTNLLQTGRGDTNGYFTVAMASEYGDVNKYVENGYVSIAAKNVNSQKNFLEKPMTLRLTANDFYTISMSKPDSWYDFDLLIANLMDSSEKKTDQEVFFPIPVKDSNDNYISFTAGNNVVLKFPGVANANPISITGIDKDGNALSGNVRYVNKKIRLTYKGLEYVYDSVYNCWKRS